MKFKIAIVNAAAMLATAWTAGAAIVNYTVDGVAPQQFPGPLTAPVDAPHGANGYPGDTVEVQTYTGSFDLTLGSSIQKINNLLWTIDYTYGGSPEPWPDMNLSFNAVRSISIDGGPAAALSQAGDLLVNYDNDYLGFDAGSRVSLYVGGYRIDITPLALASVGGSNFDGSNPWVQPERDMMARFDVTAVPEPSTCLAGALLLLPFGASTLRILRKSRAA